MLPFVRHGERVSICFNMVILSEQQQHQHQSLYLFPFILLTCWSFLIQYYLLHEKNILLAAYGFAWDKIPNLSLTLCGGCYANNLRDCKKNFLSITDRIQSLKKDLPVFNTNVFKFTLPSKIPPLPSPRLTFTWLGSFDFYIFSEENLTDLINL